MSPRTLLLGLLALAGCTPGNTAPAAPAAPPPAVRVHAARPEAWAAPVHAVGFVFDREQREVGFAVGGTVAALAVEEGATVRRGQVLARLDPTPFDAQLAQARAALDKARRDHARLDTLRATGAMPQAPLDDAATGLAVAEQALRLAQFQRARAVLVAEDDGVVLRRLADPGEVVGPGTPVVSLAAASRGRVVRVALVDREVVRVAAGDPATVTLDALPGRTVTGHVAQVAAAPSPGTGLFEVEVAIDAGAELPAQRGLVARARIVPRADAPVFRLPADALVEVRPEGLEVFVVDAQGVARRRALRGAAMAGDAVSVPLDAGLAAGDRVVVAGLDRVDDGAAVRVLP